MRSLSETAESGSTLAAIERLEEELRLREQAVAEPQPFVPEPFISESPAVESPFSEPYTAEQYTGGPYTGEPVAFEPPANDEQSAVAEPPAAPLPEPWPMEPPPPDWAPPAEDETPTPFDAPGLAAFPPPQPDLEAEAPAFEPEQPVFPPDESDLPPVAPAFQPEEPEAEEPWTRRRSCSSRRRWSNRRSLRRRSPRWMSATGEWTSSELPPPIGIEPVEPALVDPALLAPPEGEQPFTPYDAPPLYDAPPPYEIDEPFIAPIPEQDPADTGDGAAAAAAAVGGAIAFDAMLAGARAEPPSLDREESDVIDDVDRVFPVAIAVDTAGVATQVAPPSGPIATQRLSEDEVAMIAPEPANPPAFEVEVHGLEPTVLDQRTGRSARLFWLWFAANASILSVALGAIQFSLGMSLRQAIVATLAGVAISFLPLGLGTLAGKWSGQPTMVVSRASFGVVGNVVPAVVAVLSRVFWGGVMIWLLAASVARILVGAEADLGLGETVWSMIGLALGVVVAAVVAFFGYGLLARVQLVLSILTGILVVGAAALTYQELDFATALTKGDGSWVLVSRARCSSSASSGSPGCIRARTSPATSARAASGAASMLWATFGATLPPFLLISWGAMLAASSPVLATGSRPTARDARLHAAGLVPGAAPPGGRTQPHLRQRSRHVLGRLRAAGGRAAGSAPLAVLVAALLVTRRRRPALHRHRARGSCATS